MPLPVVSLTAAEVVLGLRTFITFTSADTVPVITSFVCDEFDDEPTNSIKELKFPGSDGLLRPIRRDQQEQAESYKTKLYSVDKVIDILGTLNGFKKGTAQIWVSDPQDTAGNVRMKSDVFPCTIERDGGAKFGEEYTSFPIKITSTKTSPVAWAFDVAA